MRLDRFNQLSSARVPGLASASATRRATAWARSMGTVATSARRRRRAALSVTSACPLCTPAEAARVGVWHHQQARRGRRAAKWGYGCSTARPTRHTCGRRSHAPSAEGATPVRPVCGRPLRLRLDDQMVPYTTTPGRMASGAAARSSKQGGHGAGRGHVDRRAAMGLGRPPRPLPPGAAEQHPSESVALAGRQACAGTQFEALRAGFVAGNVGHPRCRTA